MNKQANKLRWITGALLALMAVSAEATPSTSYFIYDEAGHVIGEYDSSGNPVQEHIYLGDRPAAVVTSPSSSGGTVDYVSTDQLNTPRTVTDGSKAIIWVWSSDPFGNGNPMGSFAYNLRLPGQYYDAETGHNYNYYRDYDATTGRYIESDLIGLLAGPNTYAYTRGNPIRSQDMFGLNSTDCAKLLEEIYSTAQFLQGLINSYDPWSDGIGGWLSPRSGKPTRPGGHYDQIEQRQRQLGNDIAQYDRDCRKKKKCDDDDDEPPSPPVPQFITDLANEDVPSPLIPALPDMPNFNIGPPPGFSPGASGFPAAPPPIIPVP